MTPPTDARHIIIELKLTNTETSIFSTVCYTLFYYTICILLICRHKWLILMYWRTYFIHQISDLVSSDFKFK